jgi:hypothetical protein
MNLQLKLPRKWTGKLPPLNGHKSCIRDLKEGSSNLLSWITFHFVTGSKCELHPSIILVSNTGRNMSLPYCFLVYMVMAIHPCICMHDVNVTTMTSELFSSFLKATTEPKMYKCQFNARTRGLQDQSTPRSEIRRIDKVWLVCIRGRSSNRWNYSCKYMCVKKRTLQCIAHN